jgi:hypothetical protein
LTTREHVRNWPYPSSGGFLSPALPRTLSVQVDTLGSCYLVFVIAVWTAGLFVGFIPALTVLTYAGLFASILGVARPALGLLGITTLCTLNSTGQVFVMTGGLLRWNTVNYLLLLVMVLSLPMLLRLRDIHTRLLQTFFLVLLVGSLFSSRPFGGLNHAFAMITVFGLFVYCSRAIRDRRAWYWMAFVNGILSAAGGLVYFIQYDSLPSINANALAQLPLTGIFCICLAFPLAGRFRQFWLIAWLLLTANAGWIFLTGSRGSMLAAACCGVYLWLQIPRTSQRLFCSATLVLAGLFVSTHFAERSQLGQKKVGRMFDSNVSYRARTSGRSEIVVGGVRMFLAHPLGVGTGGFRTTWHSGEFTRGLDYGQNEEAAAHSAWLQVLAENGIPGIIAFGCYVLSFACVGWRKRAHGIFSFGVMTTTTLGVAYLTSQYSPDGLRLMAAGGMAILTASKASSPPLRQDSRGGQA